MSEWNKEIEQHLEDRYRDLRAAGTPDQEARHVVDAERAELAGRTGGGWPSHVARDLRFALRGFRRESGFAAVVVATLALGIGANAAIFSVVDGVLLRPLPFHDADRLIAVWGNLHRPGLEEIPASAGEFVDYRDRAHLFDGVAAWDTDGFNLTGGGEPERVEGAIVSPSLFPLLGVGAEIGRTFLPDEERPGREQVVLLSHALWTRRFHADRAIVGRTIDVDGRPAQIVGVMPAGFRYPETTMELWKPILLDADALSDNNRGSRGLAVIARMKRGVALDRAHADLDALAATFKSARPANYAGGFSTVVRPLRDEIVGAAATPLALLLGAVGLVLLIACVNVANLTLARAASRAKELTLRAALGASRARLVQQLLTESLLAAAAGGAAGLLAASWSVKLIVALAPDGIPRLEDVSADGRVVAFAAIVSIGAGLVCGLVPAWRASGTGMDGALKEAGRGTDAPMRGRSSRLFVVAEAALSVVLLAGAGLLIHSFAKLLGVGPGFDPSNALTFRLSLPPARYATFGQGDAFLDRLFTSLRDTPGVVGAAATNALPFSGVGGSRSFYIEGRAITRPQDQPEEQLRIVTDGYFSAMRIPVVAGRAFAADDTLARGRVAVVNEAFARKHFANGSPLGARIAFNRAEPHWYEIVGVVGDVKHRALDAADRPELYVPYRQPLFTSWTVRPMYIVVRTAADPGDAVPAVRREIARLDPDQPISDVRTLEARVDRSLTARRFTMVLLAAFAAVALTLSAIGIYGVVAFSVAQRRHEFGVRLALGAQRGDVSRMVVRQGMALAAAGAGVGLGLATAATRMMTSLLYGVGPLDPSTFAAIPLVLLAVALAACYVPARRATRVDPVVALRNE